MNYDYYKMSRQIVLRTVLIAGNVSPTLYMQGGDTPTHSAVRSGSMECVRILCTHGANLSIANNADLTALQLASKLGNQQCLRNLTAGIAATNRRGIIIVNGTYNYSVVFIII